MTSRREFLYSVSAMAATSFIEPVANSAVKSYGIAYTSFPIRMRQAREAAGGPGNQGPAIPAEKFIDLCQSFGADGCQMDFSQLASTDAEYLKRVRAQFEAKGMFMELAVRARALESEEEVAKIAAAAHQLGVSRLRMACLSGRRYEDCIPEPRARPECAAASVVGHARLDGTRSPLRVDTSTRRQERGHGEHRGRGERKPHRGSSLAR